MSPATSPEFWFKSIAWVVIALCLVVFAGISWSSRKLRKTGEAPPPVFRPLILLMLATFAASVNTITGHSPTWLAGSLLVLQMVFTVLAIWYLWRRRASARVPEDQPKNGE